MTLSHDEVNVIYVHAPVRPVYYHALFLPQTQSPLKLGLWRHWQTKVYVTRCNMVTKTTVGTPDVMSFTKQIHRIRSKWLYLYYQYQHGPDSFILSPRGHYMEQMNLKRWGSGLWIEFIRLRVRLNIWLLVRRQ